MGETGLLFSALYLSAVLQIGVMYARAVLQSAGTVPVCRDACVSHRTVGESPISLATYVSCYLLYTHVWETKSQGEPIWPSGKALGW